ncbi:MAG: sugar phosphate isomerase/epimerase [Lachnospiraceae bacterium]|nr:sugar phosphate isomerase/epimerase [Lachnospiraceae bacterium]
MNRILCSTGALIGRPNGRNYRLLRSVIKELHCDGLEFMMYDSWYDEAEQIVEYLQGLQITIPVVHCEKSIGEKISQSEENGLDEVIRRFTINCRMAREIQAEKMVIHLWDGLTSDRNIRININVYSRLAEIAAAYGIDLLVENVVCNMQDPMSHWCELAEKYTDIHFVFDTKMAAFHEQVDLLYEKKYEWLWKEGHIRHYHVNDYAGGYMEWGKLRTLPIGMGNVDFRKFFDFIHQTKYQGDFTVEATAFGQDGMIDTAMLNRCFDDIRDYMKHK